MFKRFKLLGRLPMVLALLIGHWTGTPAAAVTSSATLGEVGLTFGYPGGLPAFVEPGVPTLVRVEISGLGGTEHEPGTARLFAAVGSGPFENLALVDLGNGVYDATLPATTTCAERLTFFFTADALDGAGTFSDPPDAPARVHEATAALGTELFFEDDFESGDMGWTVVNEDLGSGGWERAAPNATFTAGGAQAAPGDAASGAMAFVTGNGPSGGDVGENDVDRGPTDLFSPPINLLGVDARISYARWFFSQAGVTDAFEVAVSADGAVWATVEIVDGANNAWTFVSFRVSDFIVPGPTVQVRFRAQDRPNDSVTEAGIDLFRVERLVCDCATIVCDDDDFCNGVATCSTGLCAPPVDPCPGFLCDDHDDVCIGTVPLQRRSGEPIAGLTVDQLDRFRLGRVAFEREFTEAEGLGPAFNEVSCAACHNVPIGGSGTVTATRFGISDRNGFDPLAELGGSLLQEMAIREECAETLPPEADVIAHRLTTPALGSGLVEAILDADIEFFELNPPAPALSGRVHLISPREDTSQTRVGRFGWKSQEATVMSFSSGASAAEMGITNRFFLTELAPNGDEALLADCDLVADPEDRRDATGFAFIDRITDFQRYLAPPPQTPRTGMAGELLFDTMGCASCHVPSFTTGGAAQLEFALRNRTLRPYSDFLLHDMGEASDFIVQGDAGANEMRTTPLWGLRLRDPLWHDGRVEGGTFDSNMRDVIALHNASGSEAGFSTNLFVFADPVDQSALIAFLASLGQAEFDHDGDNDVDFDDFALFSACFSGPGSVYTPDDPCSIGDVDADGDVDDEDVENFLAAIGAVSGSVPDGAEQPGTQLAIDLDAQGGLELSWGASCSPLDDDYEIYEGTIGDFPSHTPTVCSVGGQTSMTITAGPGNVYFLIVPTNGIREGSHGMDGLGVPRVPGPATCLPQAVGFCGSAAAPD